MFVALSGFTRSRKIKIALGWYFFATGAILGNWAALLPQVKEEQDLSNATLGLVLIAAIAGALFSIPFSSFLSNRYGSGFSLLVGGLLALPLFPIVGVQHNLPVFTLGVFLLGFALGWADISMNSQAVLCEKMTRLPTLGLFHALYAIGGLSGALVGGALLEGGVAVLSEVVYVSLLLVVPELPLSCWLFSQQEERLLLSQTPLAFSSSSSSFSSALPPASSRERERRDYKSQSDHSLLISPELASILTTSSSDGESAQPPSWSDFGGEGEGQSKADYSFLYLLCTLCFLAYLGEGSVSDWGAIFFTDSLHASPLSCTFGYVACELAIAMGRLGSDYLVLSIGRRNMLLAAGGLAAGGLALAAASPWLCPPLGRTPAFLIAVLGFGITGAGIGVVAPSVISLAGDVRGLAAGDSIGLVSSVGYVGVMVGPPLLGGVSALTGGLQWSFLLDAGLMLVISLLALSLPTKQRGEKVLYESLLAGQEEQLIQ